MCQEWKNRDLFASPQRLAMPPLQATSIPSTFATTRPTIMTSWTKQPNPPTIVVQHVFVHTMRMYAHVLFFCRWVFIGSDGLSNEWRQSEELSSPKHPIHHKTIFNLLILKDAEHHGECKEKLLLAIALAKMARMCIWSCRCKHRTL